MDRSEGRQSTKRKSWDLRGFVAHGPGHDGVVDGAARPAAAIGVVNAGEDLVAELVDAIFDVLGGHSWEW